MNFYRVIKKESDCDVVMALFISELAASEYCYSMKKSMPDGVWFVDDINGDIALRNAFIDEEVKQ